MLRTILFYSISVETEFCSSSILFLGRVIYRGYVDFNFLYFLYSVYRVERDIRNYFHIFIYIFIQFGNIGKSVKWCENEIFIILRKILSYMN